MGDKPEALEPLPPDPPKPVQTTGSKLTGGEKMKPAKGGLLPWVLLVVAVVVLGGVAVLLGIRLRSREADVLQAYDLATRAVMQVQNQRAAVQTAQAEVSAMRIEATRIGRVAPQLTVQADALQTLANIKPASGPLNGEIAHDSDEFIETKCSNLSTLNFIAQAKIFAPYPTSVGDWDFGINFRDAGNNNQYRLILQSTGTLELDYGPRQAAGVEPIALENLDTSDGGSNTLRLMVKEGQAVVHLNGVYIGRFDVGAKMDAGDVCLATALMEGHEKNGTAARFEDFSVWLLP